jgi:hypothetical protein
MEFKGDETAALERVKDYICVKDLPKDYYFDTRHNGMIDTDYFTRFATWFGTWLRLTSIHCKGIGVVNRVKDAD